LKNKFLKIYSVVVLITTSSCGVYRGDFECKPGKGLGCTSAWEVNDMIIETFDANDPYDPSEHQFNGEKK